MWPLVHPFFGYLCYSAYRRLDGEVPTAGPTVAVVIGALLPDLVDQPLRILLAGHVGRSLAHSLFVAVPTILLVWYVAQHRGRARLGVGFAVGYLSHLVSDAFWPLLVGAYDELGYLLWPITSMPEYQGRKVLGELGSVTVTTYWLEAVVVLVAVGVWWRDGRPILERGG
ncbi:metal-dependent hydrolase [Natranaeroarchaeum aerophilus]|uniref:Metal-dependent hydrolase n=1 Tax=Natranaeroarchaeum aerophilus TaxID=2917711 RepID=A0AAE3FNV7_9EURY|nr:metal-dependent hydrolase [Natranaeroarchaeum aerophilus]MCL9812163.1 metal-dependent hydrolase [Natranaeroarchaeum aerophilus]